MERYNSLIDDFEYFANYVSGSTVCVFLDGLLSFRAQQYRDNNSSEPFLFIEI